MIEQVPTPAPTDEKIALLTDGSRPAALICWAEAQGIDPATALLASQLARMSEEGQPAFAAAFMTHRRNRRGDALRWLLWLWSDAETSMRGCFTETGDLEMAEAIMDMHRRALVGETVAGGEWRAARRRFMATVSPNAPTAAVEAILSSMWDTQTTPGAIADTARSWITETAKVDALAPAHWTQAEHARVTVVWDNYGIEHARHNRRHPDESDEAFAARIQEYSREHPLELTEEDWSHWNAWKGQHQRLMALRTAELRHSLLAIIAG